MKTINELFRKLITLNEIGDADPYSFSDPDGVRCGKSGWSFGGVQWDTQNNALALECLRKCGFSEAEIKGIVLQNIDVKPFAAKLKTHSEIIDGYDERQLQYCLDKAGKFFESFGITYKDQSGLLAAADAINQYGSLGSGSAAYMLKLNRPVNSADFLAMKLTWKYAKTKRGRDDTIRRANNIDKVLEA
jgi:hypothetical protein